MFASAFSSGINPLNLTTQSTFAINSNGGTIYSATDNTSGVVLNAGQGSWASVSDRNRKMNFRDVDAAGVLRSISEMPIQTWSYKAQGSGVRHIGPTAQDFYKAFHFGVNDVTITDLDESGVALVAIQALNQRINDLEQRIAELEKLLKAQSGSAKK